jgi:hypothetical protein
MAEAPKIQIDSDWKAQAQAEKQKLAEQSKAKQAGAGGAGDGRSVGGRGQMPPANFEGLVVTLAHSALYAMSGVQDPQTGQRVVVLDLARHHIDLLSVLEEKTKGNLSKEESTMIAQTLYELRSRYVQLASSARSAT